MTRFDIVRFPVTTASAIPTALPTPTSLGFTAIFHEKEVAILECENIATTAQHRNRKVLLKIKDYSYDEGAVKLVAEKNTACFLVDVGQIIRAHGIFRVMWISRLRNFVRLCIKQKALYAIVSMTENHENIRTADELESIGVLIGLNRGQAKMAMNLVERYTLTLPE